MKNINELLSKVKQITSSGLDFMEGKTKLEIKDILGQILTVAEYGFLEGDEGEYVVIAVREYPNNFLYGSSVVTQAFKQLDENFSKEDIQEIINYGLMFRLEECISKNKRKYIKIKFMD